MPVAPNTASSMIVRTASNPAYTIYNLGQNQILLGQDIITSGQLGSDFNFAGPGAVVWDFPQNTLDLWVSHPSTIVVGTGNDRACSNAAASTLSSDVGSKKPKSNAITRGGATSRFSTTWA